MNELVIEKDGEIIDKMEFTGNIRDLFVNGDNELELYFGDLPSPDG